eukprot:CAMPEP_0179297530 /NCGR_PEP_ID=MMETSP0797-20121207/45515_1 /TAXON_ID=47934 /ORGANISM="Dinophysis acuminata, Strain DAEP01" /LENGTH=260 /DNA_ID=CAMNT_0021006869 /DNA_START=1 /DNA_END=780 /DNA_ORIENTATION=-
MTAPAGCWLNEDPVRQSPSAAGALRVEGSAGSLWQTREERNARGFDDVGEPENIFLLETAQPSVLEATVAADRFAGSGQAGVYAYADAAWWVKLVVEGDGSGGCKIIFCEQHRQPFVWGRLLLEDASSPVSLRLSVEGCQAVAEWRVEPGEWHPLLRGSAWKEQRESGNGVSAGFMSPLDYGRLAQDDPKASDRAVCRLPLGWRAALITEQWPASEGVAVTFTDVAKNEAPCALAPRAPPHPAKDARAAQAEAAGPRSFV